VLAAGLLVAACATARQAPADDGAAALGTRFCAAVLAGDEAAAVALMTADVQGKVNKLRAFDAGWRARNPGEKPPLGNGLRLTAWQDAPQSCTPEPGAAGTVLLTYVPAGAPADRWRDTLVLADVGGSLRVADIRYEPQTGGHFASWLDEALNSPG
jgi:hypothetical protein